MSRAAAVFALSVLGVTPARAEIYSWVDDSGVLHFTDVDPRHLAGAMKPYAGPDTESFGGQPPVVQELPGGNERTLFPVHVTRYDEILQRAAEHYRLPFAFLKAIAKVESNFNPRAVSRADAKGLMQLMDETAARLAVDDPFDPEQAIFGGARYLRMLANRFHGDLSLTAAAYNAGPLRVEQAKGVPKIEETQRYVERVLKLYQHYRSVDS
jgi:hypothetical protein